MLRKNNVDVSVSDYTSVYSLWCHLIGVYRVPRAGLEARLGVHITFVSGLFVVVVASTGLLFRTAISDVADVTEIKMFRTATVNRTQGEKFFHSFHIQLPARTPHSLKFTLVGVSFLNFKWIVGYFDSSDL